MYIGSIGYIISLSLAQWLSFFIGKRWLSLFFLLFIAAHCYWTGAVIWVLYQEIFPNHLRASRAVFGSTTHWVLAAIIPS
jgi:hypothetical protein